MNAFGVVLKVYPSIVKEQAGSVNKHEIKKKLNKICCVYDTYLK